MEKDKDDLSTFRARLSEISRRHKRVGMKEWFSAQPWISPIPLAVQKGVEETALPTTHSSPSPWSRKRV